jgi:hypothetical protein
MVLALSAANVAGQASPPAASATQGRLPGPEPTVEEVRGEPVAVIPPGQEELLSEMLGRGATLAGGCKLSAGSVSGSTMSATYQCAGGEVVLELVHPKKAPANSTATEQLAIAVRSGTPPEGLIKELAQRIREREARFQWTWLEGERKTPAHSSSPPRSWMPIAAGVVLAVTAVLAFWALRGRRS